MRVLITRMRRQPAWIALFIAVTLALWIASGQLAAESEEQADTSQAPLPKVQVQRMRAEPVQREITLYGRSEPDRIATLRAEVNGQVQAVLVKEGQQVKTGDLLLRIAANDMQQRVNAAQASLKQRKIELSAARSLQDKGYQSQSTLAQAEANVSAAQAQLEAAMLDLQKVEIHAPFDGVINQRFVEQGDLLQHGDRIATLVDLDPLVISADVTERYIQQLAVGQSAQVRMVSGEQLDGSIRYISSVSNLGTNTFNLEVQIANPDNQFKAGMSTELVIPLEQNWAIKITPAVMALDEQGNLGVKTLIQDKVKFTPIDIIKSDSQGVWLSGLGEQADVIVLGHGFVRDGDQVEAVYQQAQAN